ncbi:MAG: hypothetical protein ACYSUJ_02335 [Planctomycetota bacterium]
MSKFIVASHSSEASEVLEALQHQGICHLLEAEQATVTRDAPDLIPKKYQLFKRFFRNCRWIRSGPGS